LKVERTLEEGAERESREDGFGLEEVKGAVRRLEWVVKGDNECEGEEEEEEESEDEEVGEGLGEWERKGGELVREGLGREIR